MLHRWVGIGVLALTLGLYLKTMAPSVSFWDCGEFIACSYTLSVPHPPGSPLYVLLGRLFTFLPLGTVAFRVNLMSVLSSVLAVWCVYRSTVSLGRRALGGNSLHPFADGRDVGVLFGAVVASLSLAFSYTQWFNATEAEVYGYSIFFTGLGVWLILYWEGTGHGAGNDRWLLLIAYLFGLGGGLHLLCLLTIPSLLILAWFADEKLRRLIVLLLGMGVYGLLAMAVLGPGTTSNAAIGVGVGGVLYYLYGRDRRGCYLLLGMGLLLALGYSTYATLYIRSGLDPVIDENDPETWGAFLKFLNREQYGTESMLLSMLQGRASRGYQFWHQQMKYFFQQFPFPLLELDFPRSFAVKIPFLFSKQYILGFRRATDPSSHALSISLVPYLLGVGGMVWHARQDWRRWAAVLALFGIMGFGLSLYLNMPDPQPRERHYVFGGMYLAFALWMGLGWTGLVEGIRQRFSLPGSVVTAIAGVGLLLPVGIGAKLYHIEDRTGDHIAYDYAYNMLSSCAPHSVLFTNGDNDTFPLWFLQEVEGIRRDVRVVNLSLLNTNWYIKQLRNREPKIDIRYTDDYIDSVLTDTQYVDLIKRYWPEPKTVKVAGLEWELRDYSGTNLLRIQDVMVLKIVEWNEWRKPIHFAITIPTSNRAGLDDYLAMTGMTFTLARERHPPIDAPRVTHLLYDVFQLRGISDPEVYKDANATRLLGNYRAIVAYLVDHYRTEGKTAALVDLLRWGDAHLRWGDAQSSFSWSTYYTSALTLQEAERLELATEFMEKAGYAMLSQLGSEPRANYDNLVTITDIIHDRYDESARAESLYRRAIEVEPQRPEAYYGLAASLQTQGHTREGLQIVENYIARYGEHEEMVKARQILHNALSQEAEP